MKPYLISPAFVSRRYGISAYDDDEFDLALHRDRTVDENGAVQWVYVAPVRESLAIAA